MIGRIWIKSGRKADGDLIDAENGGSLAAIRVQNMASLGDIAHDFSEILGKYRGPLAPKSTPR